MNKYPTDYGNIVCYENDSCTVEALSKGKVTDQEIVENHLQEYILKSDMILDIGAHIGCHTIMYGKMNPNANIYCFEPQPRFFSLLNENIKNNDIKNATILNNAIGDSVKNVSMQSIVNQSKLDDMDFDDIEEYAEANAEVSMVTIDSLNLRGCDFIKIDVDSFDYEVGINLYIAYHST